MIIDLIKADVKANKSAGMLTLFYLINYRVGRFLLLKRREGKKWPTLFYLVFLLNQRLLSVLFGCSIPFAVTLGKGVVFRHGLYGVFISSNAEVGDGCTVLHHVTIGSNYGSKGVLRAPVVGRNVFIGVGVKIIGGVEIGENVRLGANCLIVKSVETGNVCYAPVAEQVRR